MRDQAVESTRGCLLTMVVTIYSGRRILGEDETMSERRPVFSAANLLAYLEATSLGLVNVSEDARLRASEAAEELKKAQSRKWRAHRRPSPGRSRPMREMSPATKS